MRNGFGRLRLAGIALIVAAALGAAVPGLALAGQLTAGRRIPRRALRGAWRLLRRGEPDPGQPVGNPGRVPAIQSRLRR